MRSGGPNHRGSSPMCQVEAGHADNLRNQHMRYMWIPHTDAVVVVASNPLPAGVPLPPLPPATFSEEERSRPLARARFWGRVRVWVRVRNVRNVPNPGPNPTHPSPNPTPTLTPYLRPSPGAHAPVA